MHCDVVLTNPSQCTHSTFFNGQRVSHIIDQCCTCSPNHDTHHDNTSTTHRTLDRPVCANPLSSATTFVQLEGYTSVNARRAFEGHDKEAPSAEHQHDTLRPTFCAPHSRALHPLRSHSVELLYILYIWFVNVGGSGFMFIFLLRTNTQPTHTHTHQMNV